MPTIEKKYARFTPLIKRMSSEYSQRSGIPYEDVFGTLSLEFYEKTLKYDERKCEFGKFIKPVLRQCAIRLMERREGEYHRRVSSIEEQIKKADPELTVHDLLGSDYNLEFEVISSHVGKTMSDKLQLIEHLTAGIDELTTAIVKIKLTEPDTTWREIGRRLGINPTTAMRRVEKLRSKYSVEKFGDLDDYLAS